MQREALAALACAAKASPSCLICFEADFNRCHRTYVARAAAALGGTKDLIAFTEYTFGRYGTALDYPSYDAMARPRM